MYNFNSVKFTAVCLLATHLSYFVKVLCVLKSSVSPALISCGILYVLIRASLVAQMAKHLPAMQETRVRFRGQEDPLEKEMAIHSSILGWIIPTDREAWQATVQGVTRVIHNLATKPPPPNAYINLHIIHLRINQD